MNIYELGQKFAEEFKEREEDFFIETVTVDGREVVVSAKYAPVRKEITNEDVFKLLLQSR